MRLRARCNYHPCRKRRTLPNTPRNVCRLQDREIVCKACGKGRLYQEKGNRQQELDKRQRCTCDGVVWADMRGSPHDINTEGCRFKELEQQRIDLWT